MILGACGGGDDGKSVNLTDASTTKKDGPATVVDGNNTTVDGPTSSTLMGLGQVCNQTKPCPSNAMQCLSTGSGDGFCSLVCHADATFMTDANGNPTDPNLGVVAADTSKCTAAYTGGSAGTANCDVPVGFNPAIVGGQPKPNTKYTYNAYCGIDCGTGNTCPTGLTCNTQAMLCAP